MQATGENNEENSDLDCDRTLFDWHVLALHRAHAGTGVIVNIHMMAPATGHWIACYEDGSKVNVACWALIEESRTRAIVGLIPGEDAGLIPADDRPGFLMYKKRCV